jgi:hypothetical protein
VREPEAAVASPRAGSAPAAGRTLRDWLSEREPAVPAALLAQMGGERPLALAEPPLEALAVEARAGLRDARVGAGERGGAYRLLVADAYLTYACEVALASGDPAGSLQRVVHQVVSEAGVG